jgi:hypothetical protein
MMNEKEWRCGRPEGKKERDLVEVLDREIEAFLAKSRPYIWESAERKCVPPSHAMDVHSVELRACGSSRPSRGHEGDPPTPLDQSSEALVEMNLRPTGLGVLPIKPVEKK